MIANSTLQYVDSDLDVESIELTVQRLHPALLPDSGVAFAVEETETGEMMVLLVQEFDTTFMLDPEEVMTAIEAAVYEEVGIRLDAILLVEPDLIPRKSDGGLRRNTCRALCLTGQLPTLDFHIPALFEQVDTWLCS